MMENRRPLPFVLSLLAWLALMPALLAEGFIRVKEDDKSAMLQTAVTRFKKGDVTVDLVGAIHIADRDYYRTLNKRFQSYDRLLFEMVGGEALKARPVAKPQIEGAEPRELSMLSKMYHVSADFLQLVGQMDAINYRAKNFVHADLTLAEFRRMQKERKESLVGFMFEASVLADDAAVQPNSFKLLTGILRKDSNAVKLQLIPVLAQGDEQLGALESETVILTERNKRCLQVLNREVTAGHKNLGVFYGAAHYPDMVKRLTAMGYEQTGQEWVTAWLVAKAE